MNFRTDLAEEAVLPRKEASRHIRTQVEKRGPLTVTRVEILTPRGAAAVGKPIGRYVTGRLPFLGKSAADDQDFARWLGEELGRLLPRDGTVLVAGLGSRRITPDAIGPLTADRVLATRHIRGDIAEAAGLTDLRPVCVGAPGVLGQTGTEAGEWLRGLCRELRPAAVIAVDALAAADPERLGTTVQLCDTGICPGSGVGNNRPALTREAVGVPVIGLGLPTVVDGAPLWEGNRGASLMVTPRDIDLVVQRGAALLAEGINAALQPGYDPRELTAIAAEL